MESGSLYSLCLARNLIEEDFLLLESDLLYERRALLEVLEDSHESVILLSGPTGAGDEVWVETDAEWRLVGMSKNRSDLGDGVSGELVGITKIGTRFWREMQEFAVERLTRTLRADYETDGLVGASGRRDIWCRRIDHLLWAEIDDVDHLERAKRSVWPAIQSRKTPYETWLCSPRAEDRGAPQNGE
jgi:2-aminoethylphosphonate-pyruvate transaminase